MKKDNTKNKFVAFATDREKEVTDVIKRLPERVTSLNGTLFTTYAVKRFIGFLPPQILEGKNLGELVASSYFEDAIGYVMDEFCPLNLADENAVNCLDRILAAESRLVTKMAADYFTVAMSYDGVLNFISRCYGDYVDPDY